MTQNMKFNEPHCLRTVFVLLKKELAAYFNSPIAYVVISVFLVVGNWLFFKTFFLLNDGSVRAYFDQLPWLLLFLAPALTMRLWAEEKKVGTIEFLLTLPIYDWEVVVAKFLGSAVFLALTLGLTASLPVTVNYLGGLDVGPVIGGYVGAYLLGLAFLAVGLAASCLTKNQIIAFLITLAVCFALFIGGSDLVLAGLPDWWRDLLTYLGFYNHYANAAKGVLDSRDFIYYFTVINFFLWLNTLFLEGRKWR